MCQLGSPCCPGRSDVYTHLLCAKATAVVEEVARSLWPLKTHLRFSGGRCGLSIPAHCALRNGGELEMCLNSDLFPFPPLHQILSCGQPAATGSAWMDSLRRPQHPREPGRRPIPTPGTAPSLPQQARNQAARPVGPTSQTWPGR